MEDSWMAEKEKKQFVTFLKIRLWLFPKTLAPCLLHV
jgi:hypothetical protein